MHCIHGTNWLTYLKPMFTYIKTSQSVRSADQLTGSCMSGTLILTWLSCDHSAIKPILVQCHISIPPENIRKP